MNKKGFTLIEIAITVVIIGLLAGFVIVQTQDKEQLFNEVKVKSDLEILKTGIVSYSFDNYNNIPNISPFLKSPIFLTSVITLTTPLLTLSPILIPVIIGLATESTVYSL
jgi:prepilin-type N-terminal cleavage/methylation domain-containing protein